MMRMSQALRANGAEPLQFYARGQEPSRERV
jgi:hypothetical protein